jgi:hypothetical protein
VCGTGRNFKRLFPFLNQMAPELASHFTFTAMGYTNSIPKEYPCKRHVLRVVDCLAEVSSDKVLNECGLMVSIGKIDCREIGPAADG